ncbi:DsbC family protein [Escherichia coli]
MSKLTKVRDVLFDKTEYVNGNLTIRYGKAKSVYIKIESGEIEEQQYFFVLSDVKFISTNRNVERCYCDIRLNDGIVISVYGAYEEVSFLCSNLYSYWIEYKNGSNSLVFFKTIVKFFGVLLLIYMLAGVILNNSDSENLTMSHSPASEKVHIDAVPPPFAHPESKIRDSEENLLASKVIQQARPNAELSALLKKGATANDYSVRIGESDQTKPVFFVFSDPLCPHCRNIEPVLEKLADDYVIDIFPVSKIGRERSKPIVETVLCTKPEDRANLWQEAVSGGAGVNNPCTNGSIALNNNNATYSRFSFIGTPTVIRGDGAVFPLTKKLNEDNLKNWLKGDF